MDSIFGRDNFLNEIIWSFDWGAKSKTRWSNKHNNILFYVKNSEDYYFNLDNCDRLKYLAPDFVGKEKAEKGKLPTTVMEDNYLEDVVWQTIVGTNSEERKQFAYPTQKPVKLIERFIKVSCPENGIVLDCFAGSGSTGDSAKKHNRQYILIDENPDSYNLMKRRLE
jgi:site-specific DNA-methyltransferase (adenine-specific)